MTRKPTREAAGKDAARDPSLARLASRDFIEPMLSLRKTRIKLAQAHPNAESASEAFKLAESQTSSVSPSRRGVIYLDADTLKPIKAPIVVARKLERTDFAIRWQAEFGRKLSAARAASGLSQMELARRSGVRQPHISKLEAGEMEPRLSTIFSIADTLGVLARSLFPTMSWQAEDIIADL